MNNNPKIAMLCFSHSVDDARVAFRESMTLKKAGLRIRIIGRTGKAGIIGGYRVYGIPVLAIPHRYTRNMVLRILLEPFSFIRFFFICLKYSKSSDVLHCHEYQSLVIALILSWFRKQKVVYDCHEFQPELFANSFFPDSSVMYKMFRRVFAFFENNLAKHCEGVITVNEFLVERFRKVCQLTCLLPNYPSVRLLSDAEENQPENAILKRKLKDKFVLGFVGYLSADMGVNKLIEMMRSISQRIPNAHLLLIGRGELEKLKKLAAKHEVEDLVSFTGLFRADELWSHLKMVDLGLCLTDPQCWRLSHSYATKVFQYCAAGIPSVLSDNPAHRDLLNKAEFALLADFNNPDEIVAKIEFFVDNVGLRRSMGNNAKTVFRESWNAEAVESNLIEFYVNLLKDQQ